MQENRKQSNGFSLIELMIIISILGILAAIVIPTFSNANETAQASSLASQINTIKKGLVLYHSDHNETYPTNTQLITNQWQALTNTTDITGNTAGDDFGPYFMKPPLNAFMNSDIVADDNYQAWRYDSFNGTIRAVVPNAIFTQAGSLQLDPTDLVIAP